VTPAVATAELARSPGGEVGKDLLVEVWNPADVRRPNSPADRRFDHRVAVQDPDWSARVDAYRHGPVWTIPKQRNTFGTHQVHSGQKKPGG
jgi:hypothetical protein